MYCGFKGKRAAALGYLMQLVFNTKATSYNSSLSATRVTLKKKKKELTHYPVWVPSYNTEYEAANRKNIFIWGVFGDITT